MPDIPEDKLDHERIATRLYEDIEQLPISSCIALFGSWGRGKTDILRRLERQIDTKNTTEKNWYYVEANPWASGHTSLLEAIGSALLKHRTIDEGTKKSLKRLGKLGLMLSNRFVLEKALSVDFEELVSDISDLSNSESIPTTPVELAVQTIDSLVNKYFREQDKVVIAIDDIDRCPPSWQRPILESLYFLRLCNSKIIFVCAMERRSLSSKGLPLSELDEIGSLCTKVFDLSHELHDPYLDLHAFALELMQAPDDVLEQSIDAFLAESEVAWNLGRSSNDVINGFCSHPELTTPRSILRFIQRLRTICLAAPLPKEVELKNSIIAEGFGFAMAMHDRYGSITKDLYATIPRMILRQHANQEQRAGFVKEYCDYIQQLPDSCSEIFFHVFRKIGIATSPESCQRISTENAHLFARGMLNAGKLCSHAVV